MADSIPKEIDIQDQDPSKVAPKKTSISRETSAKMAVKIPHDDQDDASPVVSHKQENDTKSNETNPPAKKAFKIRRDVQEKIMAYMGQELQTDRKNMSKQEVAQGCGYAKAGAHSFHYSWRDLEKNRKWVAKSGKGVFCLTDVGKDHIPSGIVLVSKKQDNKGKQEAFLKTLLKQCQEAKKDKMEIVFDILCDGMPHTLEEFTLATGYANLKSKGLGYPFSHMEKKMKILEKPAKEVFQFTDKCFPEGRPV